MSEQSQISYGRGGGGGGGRYTSSICITYFNINNFSGRKERTKMEKSSIPFSMQVQGGIDEVYPPPHPWSARIQEELSDSFHWYKRDVLIKLSTYYRRCQSLNLKTKTVMVNTKYLVWHYCFAEHACTAARVTDNLWSFTSFISTQKYFLSLLVSPEKKKNNKKMIIFTPKLRKLTLQR